jgi:hypothetical protein
MLQPALECEDTLWLLAVKREAASHPRVVGRIPRALMPDLLQSLVRSDHLEGGLARQYLDWDARLPAKPHVYVSIDPGQSGSCSIDYEEVRPDCLPAPVSQAAAQLPGGPIPRYLKCRIPHPDANPEWVIYLPVRAIQQGAGS